MWDLWVEEKAASPYAELMIYDSEVNNGGHMQFFDNVSNISNLFKTVERIYTLLSGVLRQNLEKVYNAYLELEDDDRLSEIFASFSVKKY